MATLLFLIVFLAIFLFVTACLAISFVLTFCAPRAAPPPIATQSAITEITSAGDGRLSNMDM